MRIQINKKQYEQLLEHVNYNNRKIFTPICSWFGDEYRYDDEQEYELIIDNLKAFKKYINLGSFKQVEINHGLSVLEKRHYYLFKSILNKIESEG